ncbi:MAG: translation initiation factor IF-1 [Rickettsiaceae bacterium]
MSDKEELVEFTATVIEALGNTQFKVQLENDHIITAYTSGRMRKNRIRIIVGDEVKIEISPYDLTKGRIMHRN